MKNENKWTYTPEWPRRATFTFRDIVDLVNGNVSYAKLIKSRLNGQNPCTLIDEDKRNGEALFIDEKYYFVGQEVQISPVANNYCREDIIGQTGTIQSFITDKQNEGYGMMSVRFENGDVDSFWPEEVICAVSSPKYVAQGLLKTWKAEKALDNSTSKVAPLEHYLKFNYEGRYVKLCRRLGVEPCGFAAWLRKPISSVV